MQPTFQHSEHTRMIPEMWKTLNIVPPPKKECPRQGFPNFPCQRPPNRLAVVPLLRNGKKEKKEEGKRNTLLSNWHPMVPAGPWRPHFENLRSAHTFPEMWNTLLIVPLPKKACLNETVIIVL